MNSYQIIKKINEDYGKYGDIKASTLELMEKFLNTNECLIVSAHQTLNGCRLADRWLTKLIEDKDFSPCDEILCKLLDESRQIIRQAISKAEGRG